MVGGLIHTYVPGSTTPKTTWQDAGETIANANPITLDAAGSALLYGAGSYQLTTTDAYGNAIAGYSGVSTGPAFVSDALLPVVGAASLPLAFNLLGGTPSYATYAALRLATALTNPPLNAWVQGRTSASDSAAGMFNYRAGSTVPDNDGTVLVDASGRRWVREAFDGFSPRWFGAVGDGVTDDTAAWQACIDTAVLYKRAIKDRGGLYLISSPLTISGPVRIEGAYCQAVASVATYATPGVGTWFTLDGTHLVTVFTATSQNGIELSEFGIFHNQPLSGGGWAPRNYPAAIALVSCTDCYLHDITLFNPTVGVSITGNGSGRITLERLRGQPLKNCVIVDGALDVCRFNDLHWWPFWTQDAVIAAYVLANGIVYQLGRVDNPSFVGCFSYGYLAGVRCAFTALGYVSLATFVNCGFDQAVFMLVIQDAGVNGHSLNFSNCYSQGFTGNAGNGIVIGGTSSFNVIKLSNCELRYFDFSMVAITSAHAAPAANQVFISGGSMLFWDQAGLGSKCFTLPTADTTTKIVVSGETALLSTLSPPPAGVGISVNAPPLKFCGVAVVLAGTSSITIGHGLGYTPAVVVATPQGNITPATSFWASVGATNVTITTSANVTSNTSFYVMVGLQY